MKKIIGVSFLFLLTAGLVSGAAFLKLDQPNGGETLVKGSSYPISWTAREVTQNVKLILLHEGAPAGVIADSLAPGSSPYRWTVGKHSAGSVEPDSGYAIRIKTMDGSLLDVSDGTFTISSQAAAPSLKVTFPIGGETFNWGTLQPFQWSASGIGGNVKATLMRNGSPVYELSPSVPAAAGAVGWTIGSAPGWSCDNRCGGGYKLRVEALDGSASAESPGTFSIAAAPPAGGGEPDFEPNSLDVYFQWKPDINLFNVLTLVLRISWQNKGADYQGPLKIHYIYLDALKGSKISKDAVLEIPSVSIGHNQGRADYLCTVENIPEGVESITFAVMIDPDNLVRESNEKNNFKDHTVELDRRPDLAIEDFEVHPSQFYNDDVVDVSIKVRNKGIEPAKQFSVRLTREDDKDNIIVTEYSVTIPLLAGCSSIPLHTQIRFVGYSPHSAYFVASADYDGRVPEANEKNNKRWRSYKLEPAADLSFSSTRAWQENMKLHCEFIVTNKGYAAAEGAYAFIHVSGHGYDGYRKKIELGRIPVGSPRIYSAVIEGIWGRGDCLVLFIIDDCCRLEGGPRDVRYHEMDPRDNKAEVKINWE